MSNIQDIPRNSISFDKLTLDVQNKLNKRGGSSSSSSISVSNDNIITLIAAEALAVGDIIDIDTNGKAKKGTTNCIGFATKDVLANMSVNIQISGVFKFTSGLFGSNIGKQLFRKNGARNIGFPTLTTNDNYQFLGYILNESSFLIDIGDNFIK